MNELDLLTGLIPGSPLPGPEQLAPARDRLTTAIQANISAERTTGRPAPSPPAMNTRRPAAHAWRRGRRLRPRWPGRRLAFMTCAAFAALAATAAVVIAPGHGRPATRPAVLPSTRPASAQPGTAHQAPGTVNLTAARFLQQAAAAVQRQPAHPPAPDQYVYTENLEGGARVERQWLSANGSKAGLDMIWNGSRLLRDKPIQPCTVAQNEAAASAAAANPDESTYGCSEEAGYLQSMPTSPRALLAWLAEIGAVDPTEAPPYLANDIGKAVEEIMPYTYLLPAQQAALFQLMAQTPGFAIIPEIRDQAGRTGVGIAWNSKITVEGVTFNYGGGPIIFNPKTYAYMGFPQGDALTEIAFVNRAGQLP